VATSRGYFEIPDSIFDPTPDPASRVFSALPSLRDLVDDDGLLDCTALAVTDQTILVDGHSLHYHQLLRRHFTSHINDSLIGTLVECASSGAARLRLAIDDRRLQAAADFSEYMEKDYWYGPPLTSEWLDNPYTAGRVVHENPAGDDSWDGYRRFTALWHGAEAGHKVVQMEELVTSASSDAFGVSYRKDCPYVLLRYLHAIRDIETGVFVHCDGAVRAYDEAAYATRIEEDLPPSTRATRYRKVFRLDGRIETDTWSEIVARWFRHNQLALEYLKTLSEPEV
jgi:hypothetical protein